MQQQLPQPQHQQSPITLRSSPTASPTLTLALHDAPTLAETLARLRVQDDGTPSSLRITEQSEAQSEEAQSEEAPEHVAPPRIQPTAHTSIPPILSFYYDTTAARTQFARVLKQHARTWKYWHKKRDTQLTMMGNLHAKATDNITSRMGYEARLDAIARLRLTNASQPVQRTDAWYAMREQRITASDFGKLLKTENTRINFALDKAANIRLQMDNPSAARAKRVHRPTGAACKHGTLYEPVCEAVYQRLCRAGAVTSDFGLLPHPSVAYLGASPDGVCTDTTNGTRADVGRMVEYKAPTSRDLRYGIVPEAYLAQMQGQMEVAGLDECDYLECRFDTTLNEARANALYETCAMSAHDGKNHHGKHRMPYAIGVLVELPDTYNKSPLIALTPTPPSSCDTMHAMSAVDRDNVDRLLQTLSEAERCAATLHYWALTDYQMVTVRRNPTWWADTMLPQLQHTWALVQRFVNDIDAYDEARTTRETARRKRQKKRFA